MKKIFAVILLAIIGISGLGMAVTYASADTSVQRGLSWGWSWGPGASIPQGINTPIQRSWVRLNGIITHWGLTPVNGSLWAQARARDVNSGVVREWAGANAIWNQSRLINSAVKPLGNFTYTFSAAKLVKLQMAQLNYQGNNFFLNGTWAVYNVTVTNTAIINNGITSIHRDVNAVSTKAVGQLNVTDDWTKFKLDISGIDPLTGSVRRSMIRQIQMNIFKVTDDETNKVTIKDLITVAKNYGAMPGMGNYNHEMDFNFDFKIDIADLTTVAANIQ